MEIDFEQREEDLGIFNHLYSNSGVYILASQKNSSPPPLKFFPVFVDFLRSFKRHKGILTCVLSLFSFFSSFPPFSLPFFKSSYKFFPLFQYGQKNSPPKGGGEMTSRIYIPDHISMYCRPTSGWQRPSWSPFATPSSTPGL